MVHLEAKSFTDSDHIFDTPIDVEEVEIAINRLKRDSSGGPDLVSPQHLIHSDPLIRR